MSQATATMPTYINYYILVDASQSMGIAATATDMQNLYNRVVKYGAGTGGEQGCVFGCHVPAYKMCCSGSTQAVSNEVLAHSPKDVNGNYIYGTPISLRIDSAISAIQNIINIAQTQAGATANIKFARFTR